MTRRLVVVGARGFIGRRIVESLGPRTVAVTRESHGDLTGCKPSWFTDHDVLVYSAGTIPSKASKDGYSTALSAANATFRAAEKANCRQVILISSASVYGTNRVEPRRESEYLSPITTYGRACMEIENSAVEALDNTMLAVVRPFNVYGRGGHGLVDKLLSVAKGKETIIVNSPQPVRDYISVDQVADAIPMLIGMDVTVNMGTGAGRTNQEVVDLLELHFASFSDRIIWGHEGTTGVDTSVADTSLAKSLDLPISDGLPLYIEERST